MLNVSAYVFVAGLIIVRPPKLCCNYHSPYWHLLLKRELISCRTSLLGDPANKLHVTPTDVSGFKTVGTSWTVFLNLPGVNATIVEELETFVRLWTKLWTNATVTYYFYSPLKNPNRSDEAMEKTIRESSIGVGLPVQAAHYLRLCYSTWRNS